MKRIYWVGALTPKTRSIGDHAQTLTVQQFLKENFCDYEIVRFYDYEADKLFSCQVEEDDLIFLQSGGHWGTFSPFWHSLRKRVIEAYPRNRIVQLPVSVHYGSDVVLFERDKIFFNNRPNLLVLCRSKQGAKLLRENMGVNARYFPDFVYSLKPSLKTYVRKGVVVVLRRDFESTQKFFFAKLAERLPLKHTLTRLLHKDFRAATYNYGLKLDRPFVIQLLKRRFWHRPFIVKNAQTASEDVTDANRERIVLDTVNFYRRFELVVTDRFHACVFAVLAGTPFVMLGCKTRGKSNAESQDYSGYFKEFRSLVELASLKQATEKEPPNSFLKLIQQRRSIRKWSSKTVSAMKLNLVLEAGYYAPSAANTQAVELIPLWEKETLRLICENTSPWFRNNLPAVAVLVAYDLGKAKQCKLKRKWHRRFIWQDTACASMNMMLAAESLGLKSCWATFNPEQQKRIGHAFGFLNDIIATNAVLLGYSSQHVSLGVLHQGRPLTRRILV